MLVKKTYYHHDVSEKDFVPHWYWGRTQTIFAIW